MGQRSLAIASHTQIHTHSERERERERERHEAETMVSRARCIMRASSALGVSNEMQEVRVSSSRERAWTFGSCKRDLESERRIVEMK